MHQAITIRNSTLSDRSALARLAALDDRPALEEDAVLGFVDGELRAAVALAGGEAIADPFARTSELVELLRVRATQDSHNGSHPHHGLTLRRLGLHAA